MLKPNGICVLSKFINPLFEEEFIQQISNLGMEYVIEQKSYVGTVIIIKKY